MNDMPDWPMGEMVQIEVHLKNGATARRMISMEEFEQAWEPGAYVHRVIADAVAEARRFKLPPCTI